MDTTRVSRPTVTGWERLARACRRYLEAYDDSPTDDTCLGSVGNDLRIVSAREVSRAQNLHLAMIEHNEQSRRFGGRCSCGEPLGMEWYEARSVIAAWGKHLAATRSES